MYFRDLSFLNEERQLDKVTAFNKDCIKLMFRQYAKLTEEYINQIENFIKNNPDYYYLVPYDGEDVYFFETKPTEYTIHAVDMLHRGGIAIIEVGGKEIFVCLDLD